MYHRSSRPDAMNRIIEIAALLLGGVSFFAVCFVGFAAISGTPLNEVALIGELVDAPEEGGEPLAHEGEPGEPQAHKVAEPPKEPEHARVVQSSLGMLSTWSLPSPFASEELQELVDEIKAERLELDQREAQLALRESEIQEHEGLLAEKTATLGHLRKELETYEVSLTTREFEVRRLEGEADERAELRWTEVGGVFAALDPEQAGQRLAQYSPAEASRILRAMDEEKAVEILNQLQGDRWKEYLDAYTQASKATASKGRK